MLDTMRHRPSVWVGSKGSVKSCQSGSVMSTPRKTTHRDPTRRVGELGFLECYGQAFGVVHVVVWWGGGIVSFFFFFPLPLFLFFFFFKKGPKRRKNVIKVKSPAPSRAYSMSCCPAKMGTGCLGLWPLAGRRTQRPLQATPPAPPMFIVTVLIRMNQAQENVLYGHVTGRFCLLSRGHIDVHLEVISCRLRFLEL